jgi:hypothetical protein
MDYYEIVDLSVFLSVVAVALIVVYIIKESNDE